MASKENDDIAALRRSYTLGGLASSDLDPDPGAQFLRWFEQAKEAQIREPNAMSLSTVDETGQPSVRTVLLKGVEDGRFVFFTNYNSRKATELAANDKAAILFPWIELERQVSVRGTVERIGRAESEAYFHSRPRASQIGAWVSEQSSAIADRNWLENREQNFIQEFTGKEVPLPEFWGGFALSPSTFEFWQGRPSRLHDRFEYLPAGNSWNIRRLSP